MGAWRGPRGRGKQRAGTREKTGEKTKKKTKEKDATHAQRKRGDVLGLVERTTRAVKDHSMDFEKSIGL
jgi:hypothetical protein